LWPADLGTGKNDGDVIPCRAISNTDYVSGYNLLCRLFKAPAVSPTDYAVVRITNFKYLFSTVPYTIHVADIANPITPDVSFYVIIDTYSIVSRYY
jgi:hypothetical protein